MATLKAVSNSSINMDASTFAYDDTQTVANGADLTFFDNASHTHAWFFTGAGIESQVNMSGTRVVLNGTIDSSEYESGGTTRFQMFDIPDVSAVTVWNAFQLGDDAALFGTLLIGNDTVTGSGENDTMGGFGGDDLLKGQGGADRLTGGAGDDTLRGVAGKDRLVGGDGQDRLEGGAAMDVLTGGARADQFVFNTAPSGDKITDFQAGRDTILLDNDALVALGLTTGDLGGSRFATGTDIGDVNGGASVSDSDRILYNPSTGKLYYDENGNLDGGRVLLATLLDGDGQPAPQVTAADFLVI